MLGIGSDDLHEMLRQLRLAVEWHEAWFVRVTRAVICRLPPGPHDVAEEPHRQCQFGEWYYEHASEELRQHPALADIELEHRLMHDLGRRFLLTLSPDGAGNPDTYDAFRDAVDHLHATIRALRYEIEESLYTHDALTGAENRIGMLPTLRDSRELVKRNAQACALMILDLDHFKTVNDEHGHLAGDRVLVALVKNMRLQLRPYDRVFRYGGEEFLILLPNTDLATAQTVAERIRMDIAALDIDISEPDPVRITASFGIAKLDGDFPVEESIRRADTALFAAKRAGRNHTCLWEETMPEAPKG